MDYKLSPGRELKRIEFEQNDKQEPIISIITPYYNGQKYLQETANSIFNQTFPYWEWLIIDDGSNMDEAKEKLKEIAGLDKRIKVFHKENGGPAAARDFGLEKTAQSSKYIMFLDSDDQIEKTYFECCYWALETNKEASWCCTDVVVFDGEEYLWRKWYNPDWEKDENILMMASFVRKDALKEVGGFGLKERKVYEDWYLWLKLIKNGKFPVRISSLLTWYRVKSINESELKKSKKENNQRAMQLIKEIKKEIKDPKPGIQYPKEEYDFEEIEDKQESIVNLKQKKNGKNNILMIVPWMVTRRGR